MPLSTTVGLSRIHSRGSQGKAQGYAAPIRGFPQWTLNYGVDYRKRPSIMLRHYALPYVQEITPISIIMDDDSTIIAAVTGVGGMLGWLNAQSKVDEICINIGGSGTVYEGNLVNFCEAGPYVSADSAEATLANAIDIVYPSSILTGLLAGFVAGVLAVMFVRLPEWKSRFGPISPDSKLEEE